jgi:hypothetical protein
MCFGSKKKKTVSRYQVTNISSDPGTWLFVISGRHKIMRNIIDIKIEIGNYSCPVKDN